MAFERIIEGAVWVLSITAALTLIPKNKTRQASVAFLFMQFLTVSMGHLVAELHLIEYPFRLFPYATQTNFTFEFLFFPMTAAFFCINYPKSKSYVSQSIHYFVYVSGIVLIEVAAHRYTRLIRYINWHWYWSWITMFITLFAARMFYRWFYKEYRD